jgi:hypothetical protein
MFSKGIARLWDSVYGEFITSIGNVPAHKHIRVCASGKGNSVVRRGAQSPRASYVWKVAGLSNSSGGATMLSHQRENAEAISHQTQPYETSASPMVGVLLVSELVLLLADRPQLRGSVYPKETEVQE